MVTWMRWRKKFQVRSGYAAFIQRHQYCVVWHFTGESGLENEDGEHESKEDSDSCQSSPSSEQQRDECSPADDLIADQSYSTSHMVREEGNPFSTLSIQSVHDDVEKGKAVKLQNGRLSKYPGKNN